MKKLTALLMILALSLAVLAGCAEPAPAPSGDTELKVAETTRVVSLKGPTGMGMAKMMTDADEKYAFELTSMPEDVTSAIISKSVDIAAVPTNLASVLYNKTEGGVKVIALNTLGVLYILSSDESVTTLEDLKGMTIGATGQASTPEYILRYVLSMNGIDPDRDVTIEYYADHSELAAKMIKGDVKVAMLPEPNVSTVMSKNANVKKIVDMTAEWEEVSPESALVQGCLVVRSEFLEQYPDSVKAFLSEYKASVDFANTSEDAPAAIAALGIVPSADIAKAAIPSCNITYIDSTAMKDKLSGFLKVLFDANPKAVGGALPDDAFYYVNE